VLEFPQLTETAAEAAQEIGRRVEQIAKSLVFCGKHSGTAILAIASGSNRVEKSVAVLLGKPLEKADADFVCEQTEFVIGGVPLVGHRSQATVFIDKDLLQYEGYSPENKLTIFI
jgi:prolyl-tRNA editing enzyme YbaK/EbsC (Cys-tRNA(Pro) deacylase)